MIGVQLHGSHGARRVSILTAPNDRLSPGGFFPAVDPTTGSQYDEQLKELEAGRLPAGWGPKIAAVMRKYSIFEDLKRVENVGKLVILTFPILIIFRN